MSLGSLIVCAVTSKAIKTGLGEHVEINDDALEMSHRHVRVQMPRILLVTDGGAEASESSHEMWISEKKSVIG